MKKIFFASCLFLMVGVLSSFSLLDDSAGVVVVDDYQNINSFKELTERYKGKVLYVDVWATWCGPCRREFNYKDKLHKFAEGKDIEFVYISADKEGNEKKWENFIHQHKIEGQHVLANRTLMDDLSEQFYSRIKRGRKMMMLPTFIIVGKDGRILNRAARRPSEGARLYRQLAKALK